VDRPTLEIMDDAEDKSKSCLPSKERSGLDLDHPFVHRFANATVSPFLQITRGMKFARRREPNQESVLGAKSSDRGTTTTIHRLYPIVRVEARRHRQRLAEYYDGPGKSTLPRIEFSQRRLRLP
jgi:hypothetical protein